MKAKLSRSYSLAGLVFLLIPLGANAVPITLDFETGAPCCFVNTVPLANLGGVTFTGVDGAGGSILNQGGNFGVNARSGTDFYAFNAPFTTGRIVDLGFGGVISSFSIYASAGRYDSDFLAEAFDASNNLLDSSVFDPSGNEWGLLSLFGTGINRVRLTFASEGCCAVYDDLTYDLSESRVSVPEPGTLALFGIGLAVLGMRRRRVARALATN